MTEGVTGGRLGAEHVRADDAASMQAWQAAWRWLCQRRRHAPAQADIWHLWFHRARDDAALYRRVQAGRYRLSPMQIIHPRGDESHAQWSAQDALVLKWVALRINGLLPVHPRCVHLTGHRGGRDTLSEITAGLARGVGFVYRTDIRGYYRHIDKAQCYHWVCLHLADPVLRDLIHQYLYYSVEESGNIRTPTSGISRGCALSPLIGATLLYQIDSHFAQQDGLIYLRYMDDFLFLSERRWPIRRARTRLHRFFDAAGFECHPDKTQVGRVAQGFDWLGVWFTAQGATGIAPRAMENHRLRRLRLEERAQRRGLSSAATAARVQAYESRWTQWAEERLRSAASLPSPHPYHLP